MFWLFVSLYQNWHFFRVFQSTESVLLKVTNNILLDADSSGCSVLALSCLGFVCCLTLSAMTYSLGAWNTVQESRVWFLTGFNLILNNGLSHWKILFHISCWDIRNFTGVSLGSCSFLFFSFYLYIILYAIITSLLLLPCHVWDVLLQMINKSGV